MEDFSSLKRLAIPFVDINNAPLPLPTKFRNLKVLRIDGDVNLEVLRAHEGMETLQLLAFQNTAE